MVVNGVAAFPLRLGDELADACRLLPDFVAHLDASGTQTVTIAAALTWAQRLTSGQVNAVGPGRMTAG